MFERFTREARQVVKMAVKEAELRDDTRIGTEHLLIAIGKTELVGTLGLDGPALRTVLTRLEEEALEAVGVTADEIGDVTSRRSRPRKGHTPFTGGGKETLTQALREAIALGHGHIGAEHIALALTAREDHDRATRMLRVAGLEPTDLRRSLLASLRRAS